MPAEPFYSCMAFNIFIPPLFLSTLLSPAGRIAFFAGWIFTISYQVATTARILKRWAPYLYLCIPMYFASLPLVVLAAQPARAVALAVVLLVAKIGLCMSVCLHRYLAHGAFKCGPATHVGLCVLGCLANQGGPLWWASKHRCHHKYCDGERDPHSPLISGALDAFQFHTLKQHKKVDEEFCPPYVDGPLGRLIDNLFFVPVSLEMLLAYALCGPGGLWATYTSSCFSQVVAQWFNVMNHPPERQTDERKCASYNSLHVIVPTASNRSISPNLLFYLVSTCIWVAHVTGEATHEHHHDHAALARRPGVDLPFHLMVRPLSAAGLIWATKLPSATA